MILDTEREASFARYQAGLAFARAYHPRGRPTTDGPRVMVTGFGPFGPHRTNATAGIVNRLLDSRDPGDPGDPRGPARDLEPRGPHHVAVAQGVVALEGQGPVEICALKLPVAWDLAALVVIREAEAFGPDVLVMSGIAGARQPLFIELGALNRAARRADAALVVPRGEVVVAEADTVDNRASFVALRDAARDAIASEHARDPSLAEVLPTARLTPTRESNAYVCNNTTFAVGHALARPGARLTLFEASHPRACDHGVVAGTERDLSRIPRLFLHWPSALSRTGEEAAARVLKAMVARQLATMDRVTSGAGVGPAELGPAGGGRAPDAIGGATF